MDYSNMVTSTFGNSGSLTLVDNDNDTFTGFKQGLIRTCTISWILELIIKFQQVLLVCKAE